MSIDELTPAPVQTINGTGPYAVPHAYGGADELVVTVITLTSRTNLTLAQITLSPASSKTYGSLYLETDVAAQYDGAKIAILRRTRIEQGYVGDNAREIGLQGQLDRTILAAQDADRLIASALRTAPDQGPINAVTKRPDERGGKIFGWSDDGYSVVEGPHLQAIDAVIKSAPLEFPLDLGWTNDPVITATYDLGWTDEAT